MRFAAHFVTALALWAGAAQAQTFPAPGDGFSWQRVGDFPAEFGALAFDADHRLYAGEINLYRLDLSGGWPGAWVLLNTRGMRGFLDILVLHPDTLFTAYESPLKRSTDAGATWTTVLVEGGAGAFVVPPGYPHAGRLLVGSGPIGGGLSGVAYSDDRGDTWTLASVPIEGLALKFAALPPSPGAPAGRIVMAGVASSAVGYSDDGGTTWSYGARPYPGYPAAHELAVVDYPDGVDGGFGARAIWLGGISTQPHIRCWTSDDGGATWQDASGGLPQPQDGVGGSAAGIVPLGGASALAVLGRGIVYRTDDGGDSWAVVGRVPDMMHSTLVSDAMLGPDGRMYVAMSHTGTMPLTWTYRTEEVVGLPVASAPGDATEPAPVLSLSVTPNPTGGSAQVVLETASARAWVRVTVVDAAGREVAVLHEGPVGTGRRVVRLSTAGWAAGVYVVRAEGAGSDGVSSARFTVTR